METYKPNAAMAKEAEKALEWRKEYGRGGTSVGVARAVQLKNRQELSLSTVKRMRSFFARHEVDKKGEGFYSGKAFPSAGRIAWGLWGGDAGKDWAEGIMRRVEGATEGVAMTDVSVLAGSSVRRIDGKMGRVAKMSESWMTVEWSDGTRENVHRGHEAMAEDLEIKTLDKGWVPAADLAGVIEESSTSLEESLDELRLANRRLNEATSKAKELLKKKAAAKKQKKAAAGPGGKKHSPYKRLSSRGQSPEDVPSVGSPPKGNGFFGNPDLTTMPKANKWDCKRKGKYKQLCKGPKGELKLIIVNPAWKKKYNANYSKATAQGKTNAYRGGKSAG